MAELLINNQLDSFETIKSILRSNSVINSKFSSQDFYEFFPNLKSINFNDLPFIVIEIPQSEDELSFIGNIAEDRSFLINIRLAVDYQARDKFKNFANEILTSISQGETTLETAGYHLQSINLDNTSIELIKHKQLILGEFSLILNGIVNK